MRSKGALRERGGIVIVEVYVKRLWILVFIPSATSPTVPSVPSISVVAVAIFAPAAQLATPPALLRVVLWMQKVEAAALRCALDFLVSRDGEANLQNTIRLGRILLCGDRLERRKLCGVGNRQCCERN